MEGFLLCKHSGQGTYGGKKPPLAGGDGEESLRGQLARLTRLPGKSSHITLLVALVRSFPTCFML